MAIALVTSGIAQALTDPSVTGLDTTGANLLIAVVSQDNGAALPTLSDSKGNTWNARTTYAGSFTKVTIFYSVATSVGASHSVTATGSNVTCTLTVLAFSGAHASTPYDVENGANFGSGTSGQPGSVTPSENDELIVTGIVWTGATSAASINSSYTIAQVAYLSGGVAYGGGAAYLIQGAAAAVNPTWSWTTASAGNACQATFKKAAAAGNVKTVQGVAFASVKTVQGVAIASVKTIQGVTTA